MKEHNNTIKRVKIKPATTISKIPINSNLKQPTKYSKQTKQSSTKLTTEIKPQT